MLLKVPELVLGGTFTADQLVMFSGMDMAESAKYEVHTGKSGRRWLIPVDRQDRGSYVYVEGGPNSNGFGGSTINFSLVDGSVLSLKGPWHSNGRDMLKDTSIDVTQELFTWGCIGTSRSYSGNYQDQAMIHGLLYFDEKVTLSDLGRVRKLAKKMSDERGEILVYYECSTGGSSCGLVNCVFRDGKLQFEREVEK